MKIIRVLFLLISLMGLSFSAFAIDIEVGDVLPFEAVNHADSAGPMQGISKVTIDKPDFLYTSEWIWSEIAPGKNGGISFMVLDPGEGSRSGTLHFDYNISMQPSGLPCLSRGWEDALKPDWQVDNSWNRYLFVTVKDKPKKDSQDPAPVDTKNSDPTYIQLDRGVEAYAAEDEAYQFSPQSSPGAKDSLTITYNLAQDSLVSIYIYDNAGSLVRKLIDNEERYRGDQFDFWDGKDDNADFVPEGKYRYVINAAGLLNYLNAQEVYHDVVVDNTLPAADIEYIQADTPKWGFYTAIGSVSDSHFNSYAVELIELDKQVLIDSGRMAISSAKLASLDGTIWPQGNYTLRLTAQDYAGNSLVKEVPLVINRAASGVKVQVESVENNLLFSADSAVPISDEPTVWVDDDLPTGSTQMPGWQWESSVKYSGQLSHTNAGATGTSRHYFIHSDQPLTVNSGDNIIQYVYLDPTQPPQEIMLQFYTDDGDGEHRCYWGQNFIQTGGTSGTAALFNMGSLGPAGKWLRLKIPVNSLGLGGKPIKGMVFSVYSGKAFWDKTTTSLGLVDKQPGSWMEIKVPSADNPAQVFITYYLTKAAALVLKVYDTNDNLVAVVFDENQSAGRHTAAWNGRNSLGNQVADGAYQFRFSSAGNSLSSNAFSLVSGDYSEITVTAKTQVSDSAGNTYRLDTANNKIDKFNSADQLLFSITGTNLGRLNFNPVALEIDANDYLWVVDKNNSRVFTLDPQGYYSHSLPYLPAQDWQDKTIALNKPAGILIDSSGDIYLADQNGSQVVRLAVGRGNIAVVSLLAHIRVPYNNALGDSRVRPQSSNLVLDWFVFGS